MPASPSARSPADGVWRTRRTFLACSVRPTAGHRGSSGRKRSCWPDRPLPVLSGRDSLPPYCAALTASHWLPPTVPGRGDYLPGHGGREDPEQAGAGVAAEVLEVLII